MEITAEMQPLSQAASESEVLSLNCVWIHLETALDIEMERNMNTWLMQILTGGPPNFVRSIPAACQLAIERESHPKLPQIWELTIFMTNFEFQAMNCEL